MEKIKNIVVLIPAILFVSFGAKIIFDSISDLYYLKSAVSGHEIFEFSQYKSIMVKYSNFF